MIVAQDEEEEIEYLDEDEVDLDEDDLEDIPDYYDDSYDGKPLSFSPPLLGSQVYFGHFYWFNILAGRSVM